MMTMRLAQDVANVYPNDERARCFAAFVPESIAHYLENVWLGVPHASGAPSPLANDQVRQLDVVPVAELPRHRAELIDAMVTLYGGERETHARALLSQWSKYYFGFAATAGFVAGALLRRPLDMSPEKSHVMLRDGLPVAFYFARDALGRNECDPAKRYAPLVAHLNTVICFAR
ncbi:hypothetical protein LMG27174_05411 [Paraburkholderia rhynchosiae]|uniref:Aerobactin siderophore biosynthesis IucA/IucC-like C-terminal domain-containing protein n=1 Tax=Paraburkholderia rhynchosiae TaxID=487049 RepID=A0A6J5C6I3_9BURK|nr:hypothetical protein LMG27174_05411 [Paraburkholderia rhynchosiae]